MMFCTGGIRCEKAGPFMESQGFRNVLQLDGGILKYFEECGGAHYDGECFVFDQRVGVDPALQETDAAQCFNCQSPLTAAEQEDPRYVRRQVVSVVPSQRGGDCSAGAAAAGSRPSAHATNPLPGSVPAEMFRPLRVPQECEGVTALETFCRLVGHLPRGLLGGRVSCGKPARLAPPDAGCHARSCVPAIAFCIAWRRPPSPTVNANVTLLHEDEALIVLDKPAPLPMHAGGRYTRNTLQQILNTVYRPQKPRPAHRLDANTTGLVIVARSRHFAGRLQSQFAEGRVGKTYLVRVQGHLVADELRCDAPIGTRCRVLRARARWTQRRALRRSRSSPCCERCADGTSLLEARPLTGRTNQIRIHCAHLGHPVVGDAAYRGGEGAVRQTLDRGESPLCLHAWKLDFFHPVSGRPMSFVSPLPEWALGSGVPTQAGRCPTAPDR